MILNHLIKKNMKKLIFLFALITYSVSFSQLRNSNFQIAVNECLTTNPDDGLCVSSEYGPMPDWDVSQVVDMSYAFRGKSTFNADLSGWDVSSVVNMEGMFLGANAFNQILNDWDVSNVTTMFEMFL